MKFRIDVDTGNHYEFAAEDARDAVASTHRREDSMGTRHNRVITSLWYFDPALAEGAGQWVSGDELLADIPRPLFVIAQDVRDHWTNVYFGAEPYLRAMSRLNWLTDPYGADDGESIVLYFVESNASGWRGEDARRIKAELRAMRRAVQ